MVWGSYKAPSSSKQDSKPKGHQSKGVGPNGPAKLRASLKGKKGVESVHKKSMDMIDQAGKRKKV